MNKHGLMGKLGEIRSKLENLSGKNSTRKLKDMLYPEELDEIMTLFEIYHDELNTKAKADRDKYYDIRWFGGNREAAIQRDGEKCVNCGMTRVQHLAAFGMDITVDHIDMQGTSLPKDQRNNSLDNLQTLCSPCHGVKDNGVRGLTDIQVINIRHAKGSISSRKLAALYGIFPSYVRELHAGLWRKDLLPTNGDAVGGMK